MRKVISLIFGLILCLSLSACGDKFVAEKDALVGSKWFSGAETSNTIVIWKFYDESVEKSEYFVDGNGMHDSDKKVASYTIQKDAIKVVFDDEEMIIPYSFEESEITLEKGKYFSPQDVDQAIQGFWTLRDSLTAFGTTASHEYNVQFENGIMRYEHASEARFGAPGEYYYFGPYEGKYTIGDGKFETDVFNGNEFFFNVYNGKVNLFHYDKKMNRGEKLPGQDGYEFN